MKEIILQATKEDMQTVMNLLEKELKKSGCSALLCMEFAIAFEELFVNIVHYAYEEDRGDVKLKYGLKKEKERHTLKVELHDWGIAYNPLEKETPDISLSAKERKIGGLGILMAKKFLNEITYERVEGKNCLRFEKKF